MHVELNGFGLLLVFEVIISQQVVDFINDWRGWKTTLRKAWGLKKQQIANMRRNSNHSLYYLPPPMVTGVLEPSLSDRKVVDNPN